MDQNAFLKMECLKLAQNLSLAQQFYEWVSGKSESNEIPYSEQLSNHDAGPT